MPVQEFYTTPAACCVHANPPRTFVQGAGLRGRKERGTLSVPQAGRKQWSRTQNAAKSSTRHLLPVASMQILNPVCLKLSNQSKLNPCTSVLSLETTACAASSVVSTACSAHANPAPTACAACRGLCPCTACTNSCRSAHDHRAKKCRPSRKLSIAGSCRSRARAAPLQSRIAAVPSTAAPGHAATRACCSNASAGTLRKPLVQDLHGLNSTARDSCNPRPQWSPGPRSTDAPRARDGRMHPAPAMDGCTMRLRWTAAPRARDRRSQCPPCARPAGTCGDVCGTM